jgi:hypothetical protein
LAALTGVDVSVQIKDGKRLDSYFSNGEIRQRMASQLAGIFESQIDVKTSSSETQCELVRIAKLKKFPVDTKVTITQETAQTEEEFETENDQ